MEAAAAPTVAAVPVPDKSIAVLPFENLSSDKDNSYFADGIQDEILTRLAKVGSLKVISRTSTQKYKSAPDNLHEIGKQLGVANLLEGSVQKIANAVHVNVQLIRANTDEHLWAESYNRKLDDVFGVEGEVAGAIAEQLNAKLTGAEQKAISAKPTENAAAYDAYLRGLAIEHDRYGFTAYQEAAASHARAVQLDPKFALAWARLAVLRSFLFFNGVDAKTNSAEAVKNAADRAIALQPEMGEAWVAQGSYRYRVLRDFPAALQAYEEAAQRLPNSSLVSEYIAYVQRRLGHWKEAEPHYRRAIELAPRDLQLFVSFGSEYFLYLRRFDEAEAILNQALVFAPDDYIVLTNKAAVLQSEGKWKEAAAVLASIPPRGDDDFTANIRATQATEEGRLDDAILILKTKIASVDASQPLDAVVKAFLVQLGYCHEWAGQSAEAKATFAKAVQAIKPTPNFVVPPDSQGTPIQLALAYAGLGDKDKALAQAKKAVADYVADNVELPAAEAALAQIQARFGDHDAAIAALPHLLEVPAGITPADLRWNPLWNPLRQDPRFAKFLGSPSPN